MAEKIVSPGVFTKEIDQSFLPSAIGEIGAALVGPTVKGPALTPVVVNSYSEFQQRFGDVFRSGSNYYQYLTSHTAKNYLDNGGSMTVVRVLGSGYTHASATISSSIDPTLHGESGSTVGTTVSRGNFTITDFGAPDDLGQSCSIGGTTFHFTGSNDTQANTATDIYVVSGASVAATCANFRETINISSSLHGLNISASATTTVVGITSSYNGTNTLIPGETHIHLNGASIVSDTNYANTHYTMSSGNTGWAQPTQMTGGMNYNGGVYTEPFKLHTLSDGSGMTNYGTSPNGADSLLGGGTPDNIRWEIGSLNNRKGTFSLVIRRGDDTEVEKQILETWNDVSLDPNQPNYIGKRIGDQDIAIDASDPNDPFLTFTGDYPNKSKYVRVEVLNKTTDYLDENGNVRIDIASASLPAFLSGSNSGSTLGSFTGGSDGTVSHPISSSLYESIGSISQGFDLSATAQKNQYLTALNLLSNADEYDFNLLLIPGIIREAHANHTAIVAKAIDVCEDRGDAFVIVDTVKESTSNIMTVTDQADGMNSNYSATYWPWVQTPDQQLGKNVWVPPSVVMAGIYAFNDKVAAPWFAPAGLNRGVLNSVVQAKRKLTHGQRDQLYDSNVNPLATFPGQGVVVWGQKTLQKKASALDRVNVRRLMIKLKKFIASSSRFLVFEQNNTATREKFLSIVNPYLESVQSQSGLNAFKVVMDSTNNTADVVDRNILYGQIFIQPTKTAEYVVLDFTVQPTGATFTG